MLRYTLAIPSGGAEAGAGGRLETGRTMWLVAKTLCSSPLSSSEHSEREERYEGRVEPPVRHAPGAPIARNLSIMLAVWSLSACAESPQKVDLWRARLGSGDEVCVSVCQSGELCGGAGSCVVRLWSRHQATVGPEAGHGLCVPWGRGKGGGRVVWGASGLTWTSHQTSAGRGVLASGVALRVAAVQQTTSYGVASLAAPTSRCVWRMSSRRRTASSSCAPSAAPHALVSVLG